ncbi:MAG: filamentous hemagglutinin N-terminal domain-containing protein [Paraburkholderia sp.]|uniref:beta strand repeat-containing protein n=1 Tax=Paraburkholderia sp. TaxID=1926495 RepID=UPI003C42A484
MLLNHRGATATQLNRARFFHASFPASSRIPAFPPFRLNARSTLLCTLLFAEVVWLPCSNAAPPLPQSGQFVAGSGNIARNGANLNITQSSTNGVIDWCSFSIGARNTVSFSNGTGATLNRVTGNEMSLLDGKLTATGSVYLINPQGVLVGPNGLVTTGGRFVASTLDVDDNSFMAGGPLTLNGTSNGVVVNLGRISSSGGDVFLVASKAVANLGTISAPNGTAELAAGTQVLLQDSSTGQQVFVQTGNGSNALNAGTIRAAQIDLQATDGNVYALAGNHSVLRATGTTTRDGHVWLVADGGTVNAQNADISATNADGSGGTLDTSGNTLNINGANVHAAQWNLTAPVFTIGGATAITLAGNLSRGTSVTVNATGANGATGDINVQDGMTWNGASTLALNAYHSISLAPGMTIANKGAGNLTLRADSTAIDNGGSVTNLGTIDWSGSTGIVSALYDMNGTYTAGAIDSNSAWSAAPFSGLVTQVTAYQLVNSIADLEAVNNNLAGDYALGTNVIAPAMTSVPALGSVSGTPFTGQFDGMGYSLTIPALFGQPDVSTVGTGLFSVIGTTGVVRNLNLSALAISDGPDGLLAGENDGLVTHVNISGRVSGQNDANVTPGPAAGGIVAINRGTIEQSSESAFVSGVGIATGGAVGENFGTIIQVAATGTIFSGITGPTGGLVGLNAGTVNESYSTGTVGSEAVRGGLVGENTGTIQQSYTASPQVVVVGIVGGLAGSNQGTIANDVYWNISVEPGLEPGVGFPAGGVGSGTPVPASSTLTTAQMSTAASFGPTWNFGAGGVWALPAGAASPVLQWQLAQP